MSNKNTIPALERDQTLQQRSQLITVEEVSGSTEAEGQQQQQLDEPIRAQLAQVIIDEEEERVVEHKFEIALNSNDNVPSTGERSPKDQGNSIVLAFTLAAKIDFNCFDSSSVTTQLMFNMK